MYPNEKSQPNQELKELKDKYSDRKLLWTDFSKFIDFEKKCFNDSFVTLDVADITQQMKNLTTSVL